MNKVQEVLGTEVQTMKMIDQAYADKQDRKIESLIGCQVAPE